MAASPPPLGENLFPLLPLPILRRGWQDFTIEKSRA
jgi:hypothetical protein